MICVFISKLTFFESILAEISASISSVFALFSPWKSAFSYFSLLILHFYFFFFLIRILFGTCFFGSQNSTATRINLQALQKLVHWINLLLANTWTAKSKQWLIRTTSRKIPSIFEWVSVYLSVFLFVLAF